MDFLNELTPFDVEALLENPATIEEAAEHEDRPDATPHRLLTLDANHHDVHEGSIVDMNHRRKTDGEIRYRRRSEVVNPMTSFIGPTNHSTLLGLFDDIDLTHSPIDSLAASPLPEIAQTTESLLPNPCGINPLTDSNATHPNHANLRVHSSDSTTSKAIASASPRSISTVFPQTFSSPSSSSSASSPHPRAKADFLPLNKKPTLFPSGPRHRHSTGNNDFVAEFPSSSASPLFLGRDANFNSHQLYVETGPRPTASLLNDAGMDVSTGGAPLCSNMAAIARLSRDFGPDAAPAISQHNSSKAPVVNWPRLLDDNVKLIPLG